MSNKSTSASQPQQQSKDNLFVELMDNTAFAPHRATPLSAGYDLKASASFTIQPWSYTKVPLKIRVMVPEGTYGRIAPRSSMAQKNISVDAGVIDGDYQGEVIVMLRNHSDDEYHGHAGDKIAQLILERVMLAPVKVVGDIVEIHGVSERGAGGFGSTGRK